MGERFIDDLARGLAEPMPRGRAVRVLGAAVITAAAPALWPRPAAARGTVNCAAKPDTPVPCSCPAAGGLTYEICCWDERACNCHPTSANCCPEPKIWNGTACVEECASGVKCQGKCCPEGFKCCPPTRGMPAGRCYDPTNKCCTPVAGVVRKFPIKTATDCPDRVPKRNHKPKANGCGPENGVLKYVLPNRPFVANFKPACDYHDICYETCRRSKAFCDRQFHRLMNEACRETFPFGVNRGACLTASRIYYTAVSKGGDDAYEEAQKEACHTCC